MDLHRGPAGVGANDSRPTHSSDGGLDSAVTFDTPNHASMRSSPIFGSIAAGVILAGHSGASGAGISLRRGKCACVTRARGRPKPIVGTITGKELGVDQPRYCGSCTV